MTIITREQKGMQRLEPATARTVLSQINRYFQPRQMRAESTVLRWSSLPFYDDLLLYSCTDFAVMPPLTKYVLRRRHDVFALDYTPAPILMANAAAPLMLNAETVRDYARFFTSFVWRNGEPQKLVERIDDVPLARDVSPTAKLGVARHLRPMTVEASHDHPGGFEIEACFISGISLFGRRLLILADCNVRSSPDQTFVEALSLEGQSLMR